MRLRLRSIALGTLLCAPALAPAAARAQDPEAGGETETVTQTGASEHQTRAEEPRDPNEGALAVTGGVDFVTAYFFRGYNQEDQGVIGQPYFTISLGLVDTDAFKLTPYVGTWNSLHDERTGATDSQDIWYESDAFAGLDATFGVFKVGFIYTAYTYPNGAFDAIQEIGVKLSFDDTELMKAINFPLVLAPYVGYYLETSDGNETPGGHNEDQYLEAGIVPSLGIEIGPDTNLTISFPVTAGFSVENYYVDEAGDNEPFGYLAVGLGVALPLPMPEQYGAWSLTGGLTYLYLAADGLEAANNDDEYELIGKLGIGFTY